jgi:hypothetical protein
MPLVGFAPKISAGEWPAAARLLRSWVRIPAALLVVVWQVCQTTTNNAATTTLQRYNQRLLMQL